MPKRKNKYGAITCKCSQGHIHRSRFEAKVCGDLHIRYKNLEIRTEVKFSMDINGEHICNHYMDFVVTLADGSFLAVEAKGAQTATWKIKSKLFKALYPEYDYEITYYRK
jgi:hypothetical protein